MKAAKKPEGPPLKGYVASVLPREAALRLIAAVNTPFKRDLDRRSHLDSTIASIKSQYPDYFREKGEPFK